MDVFWSLYNYPVIKSCLWSWLYLLTCFEQTDREGCLCQEVRITEHVLLIDSEAQKGEGGVVDVEHKLFLHPYRIQTIISWEGREKQTVSARKLLKCHAAAAATQQLSYLRRLFCTCSCRSQRRRFPPQQRDRQCCDRF